MYQNSANWSFLVLFVKIEIMLQYVQVLKKEEISNLISAGKS